MEYFESTSNIIVMYPPTKQNSLNDAPQTVTTTCIVLPNSLIFVDCGIYPNLARTFRMHMEKKFNKKTSHLFITHAHWDHIFALEAFKDVIIVSSKAAYDEIQNLIEKKKNLNSQQCLELFKVDPQDADVISKLNLILPNTVVTNNFIINSEEGEVIFQVTGGHSNDSAYIYIPRYNLLCAGDNLVECYPQIPGNINDALNIIQQWELLNVDLIIPGHGKVVTKEYLIQLKKYYEQLISTLESLYTQKLNIKDIIDHPNIPEYFGKNHLGWKKGCWADSDFNIDLIRTWYREIKYRNKNKK